MIAAVVSPGSIPEFVHPPVPGESHDFYGSTHLDSIKLPAPAAVPNPGSSSLSNSHRFSDPLGLGETNHSASTMNVLETGTQSRDESVRDHISGATTVTGEDHSEGSSEDIAWAKLVDGCVNGHAEQVRDIIMRLPQLKDSIDNISSATGMNPLHFAASRGHDDIVRILIDQAGAGVDTQDREGETALLKASYAGSLSVVCFLLKRGANVHQRDKDGWTALHNASSKGFIDIAQVLLEKGEADINARSKMGHTPLINAASKGDIALVLYFLNHARANPLLKNTFSEMAYDVAAANSEAYLCDILQSSEKQWWKEEHNSDDQIYDPLVLHSTVLVTVHENQRATGTFALSFMAPKFSATALSQQDFCGPWSLPSGRPSTKDDVHLPLISSTGSSNARANMQRGWFWMTEWVIDKTDPTVDPEGWQYGKSLTEANHPWTATAPTSGTNWVRRRRWIRVMKKRIDLIGSTEDGTESSEAGLVSIIQEMAGNYMKRASLALRPEEEFADTAQELSRYRQAIQILLRGIKVDNDPSTKLVASSLVREYLQHAEELMELIREQEEANGAFQELELETPRPQLATRSPNGSQGSSNELRSLTLQRSTPADAESMDDIILAQNGHDAGSSPESSQGSFSSATNGIETEEGVEGGDGEAPGLDAPPALESGSDEDGSEDAAGPNDEQLGLGAVADVGLAELSLESAGAEIVDVEEAGVSDTVETPHQDTIDQEPTANIPIPIPTSFPEVAVLSPSPAAANVDPFPMARLTRSPRSATPSSSSSRPTAASAAQPLSSSPSASEQLTSVQEANLYAIPPELQQRLAESPIGGSPSSSQPSTGTFSPGIGPVDSHLQTSSMNASNQGPSQERPASRSRSSLPPQQPHHYHPAQHPVLEAKWESDHKAIDCKECHRKFSLWLRRHHCRRCGHVVCDRCSSHRATLHPSMVVYDPSSSEAYINHQALSRRGTLQRYRVCDSCYTTLGSGRSSSMNNGSGSGSMQASSASQTRQQQYPQQQQQQQHHARSFHGHPGARLSSSPGQMDGSMGVYLHNPAYGQDMTSHSSSRSSSSSNLHPTPMVRNASSSSLMSECPVCGAILAGMEGGKAAQEAHVQECLEGKPGQGREPINNVRYIVYKLPADSPLVDQECAICFEEFVAAGFNMANRALFTTDN
ncbi:hypothetical protein BGZ97_002127 [Linnemannia gamsii]|uniref:FYVE-type domain-containing protein n=1 Tax=Linnemannia gamsii TaxID=64522 RepID=A0A9P6R013_9FUNG|nr:hypothetical protein BGZ97_002127 [Linnemannia gamsii]